MRTLQHEIAKLPRVVMFALLPQPAVVVRSANLLEHTLARLELHCKARNARDICLRRGSLAKHLRVDTVFAPLGRLNVTSELGFRAGFPVARQIESGDASGLLFGSEIIISLQNPISIDAACDHKRDDLRRLNAGRGLPIPRKRDAATKQAEPVSLLVRIHRPFPSLMALNASILR